MITMKAMLRVLLFCFAMSEAGVAQTPDGIQWMSMEEAEAACKKKPRKIFVDVYTDWCGWCKKMDKSTFRDSLVMKLAGEKFYSVKLNAEGRDNIIFRDKVFHFSESMRANELAVMLLSGEMSYPSIAFLDEKLQPIQTHGGYADATQFHLMLRYFSENAYKKKSLNEFSSDAKR
jgi:thioredoxin-related protein